MNYTEYMDNDLSDTLNDLLSRLEDAIVELREATEYNNLLLLDNSVYDLESAALRLRGDISSYNPAFIDMPYNTTDFEQEKDKNDIKAWFEEGIFHLELPVLALHRKAKAKEKLIFYRDLKHSLKLFSESCNYGNLRKAIGDDAVIVVIHHYSAKAILRDNYNIELKAVVDMLHIYGIIRSDSGDMLSTYQTISEADIKYTEVLVMSRKNFEKFICERQ